MIEKTSQTYENFTKEVLTELKTKRNRGEISEKMYKTASENYVKDKKDFNKK